MTGPGMRPFYAVCRFCCQALYLLCFRGRVFGRENVPRTGGALLVCNHQSFLDPVLSALSLPRECHFMARDTLFRGGFFKPLIESLNAFPVKRATADIGAIKETLRRLKQGALITVFPEGTRTESGAIGEMQSGVILIARKAGVPVIPTLILGAFEAWPRKSLLPTARRILVAHAEPLSPADLASMSDAECIATVRNSVVELMQRYRQHPGMRARLKQLPNQFDNTTNVRATPRLLPSDAIASSSALENQANAASVSAR